VRVCDVDEGVLVAAVDLAAGCNISGQVMTCRPGNISVGSNITIPVQVIPTTPDNFTPSATVTANGDVTPGNSGPANTLIVVVSSRPSADMTHGSEEFSYSRHVIAASHIM